MKQKIYSSSDLMKLAIEEHLKCTEFPRVGAILAKHGKILATGYRGESPRKHAERIAIEKLSIEQLAGATLYSTLEPCVCIRDDQGLDSCADLIIASGIEEVYIGILDPNGTIYSQGFRKLLQNNISVKFFSRKLRAAIEEETFEFGEVQAVYGSGKRRVPVVLSGIEITVFFSRTDARAIPIKWATLQPFHGCVDVSSHNGAVTVAAGAATFSDVTDPSVFRFPSHFARLREGGIAIIKTNNSTFCVLVRVIKIFENDILFQWEVRNDK
ncbi:deaminase [Stenotrophomonas bentonitica]